MNEQRVIELLEQVLDQRTRIDSETHAKHHAFLDELIATSVRKRMRVEKVKAHVYGWSIITAISGVGATMWYWIKDHIR